MKTRRSTRERGAGSLRRGMVGEDDVSEGDEDGGEISERMRVTCLPPGSSTEFTAWRIIVFKSILSVSVGFRG